MTAALELQDGIVEEVRAGNLKVVCAGVTSQILPGKKQSIQTIFKNCLYRGIIQILPGQKHSIQTTTTKNCM